MCIYKLEPYLTAAWVIYLLKLTFIIASFTFLTCAHEVHICISFFSFFISYQIPDVAFDLQSYKALYLIHKIYFEFRNTIMILILLSPKMFIYNLKTIPCETKYSLSMSSIVIRRSFTISGELPYDGISWPV